MRPLAVLAVVVAIVNGLAGSAQETRAQATLSGSPLIDKHIQEKWDAEGVKPAAPAEDAEWLRRAHLDIVGVIPPADLVLRYMSDTKPDKKQRLLDELMSSARYGQHWAELWQATLLGYEPRNLSPEYSLERWLRDEVFAKNLAYDEFARRLIAGNGSNYRNGAVQYYVSNFLKGQQATEIVANVARIFLGVQIHCAQCHDHPFDKYTQEDYVATLAFFVRARQRKVYPDDQRSSEYEVSDDGRAEAMFPLDPTVRGRKAMPPKSLDGQTPEKGESRRTAFARIATRPENPQFAKALVNRYWAHFFGRGIVHPMDEFNLRNKPSHPGLLTELSLDFIAHRYDLKWLIRTICMSRVYGLTSRKPAKGAADEKHFGYSLVRAMSPEQLFNSLIEATGVEDRYKAMERYDEGKDRVMGERASYIRQFRFTFGDDENVDRLDFHGTIPQALTLLNGDLVNRRMQEPNSRLDLILRTRTNVNERLQLVFLSVLARNPTPKEAERYLRYLQTHGNKRETYEDLMWTLLNTSEFMFVH